MGFVNLTAAQAEAEFAGDVPVLFTATSAALRIDRHPIWHGFLVILFDFGFCPTEIQPGFRQILQLPLVLLACPNGT
jgi:hypothetical protein